MAETFDWKDVHEVAYRLFEADPETDPLGLRFTELHARICDLEGFVGDPKSSNEKILEAILMAWVDERED